MPPVSSAAAVCVDRLNQLPVHHAGEAAIVRTVQNPVRVSGPVGPGRTSRCFARASISMNQCSVLQVADSKNAEASMPSGPDSQRTWEELV